MQYREFGTTGLMVSEISFGTMRMTGDAAHVARDRIPTPAQIDAQNGRGKRALEAALAGGVNCIHSSDDYGTRWMLGEVLERHSQRAEVHHVIKVTTPDYEEDGFDSKRIRSNVEAALRELHADRISFVQHLQRGPQVSKNEAYAQAGDQRRISALADEASEFRTIIEQLQTEGKIGSAVTFPHTMPYGRAALETGNYAGVAHFLNLIETELFQLLDDPEWAQSGYFAIRPLLQGMLTDKRVDRTSLDPEDHKTRSGWTSRYKLLDEIRDAVGDPGGSWTSFSLRFALSHPSVTSLVTSASSEEQVNVMLEASDGTYFPASMLRLVASKVAAAGPMPKSELFMENLV